MSFRAPLTFLFIFVTNLCVAGDILTANAELYQKANNGDIKSMSILARFYGNYRSYKYNPEHSKYWQWRIHEIEKTQDPLLACDQLLELEKIKKYNVFIEPGTKIQTIKLSENSMDNLNLVVPPEKEWHIKWFKSDCENYCSYEIAIDGYFYIGFDKNYLMGRNASISLNGKSGEIWVKSGSTITMQIDSELVEIIEYQK